MSKAFDKVWHEGLIFKLKSMGTSGTSGTLLDLIESFLESRSSVKWIDLGQISNFKKIDLQQLLSNK